MDRRTVLTKTAKGLMEVTGKTSLLSRELRSVLTQVDGKATVGDMHQKLDKLSESKLLDTLGKLTKDGFVREFVSAPASISPPSQFPIVQEEGEDLDFSELTNQRPTHAVETAKQTAEADDVARRVASARAKEKNAADAKSRTKREAEAQEKAQAAAAEKAKRQDQGEANRDAEEQAKREAKEKARLELDDKAQREAEEQARREVAERAMREEEERARRAIEERERRAAEEHALKESEAEERIRRELEERIKVAEQQAQREAESRRRREDEVHARRQAEERAQRETEERVRREAEERAQREAEEQARRDAEASEKREAEERAQRETDEQERRELEEKEQVDAGRRARDEEKGRAKAEAEAAARARRDERAREKAEADERADARAKEADKERAEVSARLNAIKSGTVGRVGKILGGTLVALLVVGLIVAQFIPLDTAFYGKLASRALGQPVKIGAGEFSLLPLPSVTLRDVVIGSDGAIRIAAVRGAPEIESLFGETRVFRSVELQGVNAQPAALGTILWGKVRGSELVVKRVHAEGVKLALPGVPLPELSVEAILGRDGGVQKLTASTAGSKIRVQLEPEAGKVKVEITAKELQGVLGLKLPIEDFGGRGTAVAGRLDFTEFDGKLLDGVLKGKGTLRWDAGWSFEGAITVKQIDATRIVPSVLASGRMEGEGSVVAAAQNSEKLLDAPRAEGRFSIGKGKLSNLDLVRMIQTGTSSAGSTSFAEITGQLSSGPERIQLRELRLSAGPLSATGNIELTSSDTLSGKIAAQMDTPAGMRRGNITLTGSVSKLHAGR